MDGYKRSQGAKHFQQNVDLLINVPPMKIVEVNTRCFAIIHHAKTPELTQEQNVNKLISAGRNEP